MIDTRHVEAASTGLHTAGFNGSIAGGGDNGQNHGGARGGVTSAWAASPGSWGAWRGGSGWTQSGGSWGRTGGSWGSWGWSSAAAAAQSSGPSSEDLPASSSTAAVAADSAWSRPAATDRVGASDWTASTTTSEHNAASGEPSPEAVPSATRPDIITAASGACVQEGDARTDPLEGRAAEPDAQATAGACNQEGDRSADPDDGQAAEPTVQTRTPEAGKEADADQKDARGDQVASDAEERKVDPDDGKVYTLEGMRIKYKEHFSEEEIQNYWRDDCTAAGADTAKEGVLAQEVPKQEERHPHENEEWYQKWLRRQKNRPRQIIDLSAPPSSELEQHQTNGASDAAPDNNGKEVVGADTTEPQHKDGRSSYENEEWYQKWLRRQEHRPRKIIYIGGDQPQTSQKEQEGEPHCSDDREKHEASEKKEEDDKEGERGDQKQVEEEEQRRDPDDGKVYTWEQLTAKYKGHFPDEEILSYWDSECKPLAPGESADPEPRQSERKKYEQEEWYQKWLRRQQNKNRQIIEIG